MRSTGTVHQLFARERCAKQAQSFGAWLKQLLPVVADREPALAQQIDMSRHSHCAVIFELFKRGDNLSQAAASPMLRDTHWDELP